MSDQQYELVAGLEMHVQLNTVSKAFCADTNTFGGDPNTFVSPVSLAHPGTLPVANKRQVRSAIKLGLALGCTVADRVVFDRKNYFYPDLPKGYQLTQDTQPVCMGGSIFLPKSDRTIRFHHIHMEEDAGKSTHDVHPKYSLIDLNRAGVPLLELVTEPDFRSTQEVHEFIEIMQKLVKYLGISDGSMEEGSIRCDCNVSIRPFGQTEYGQRCEIKNINSKRFAKIAIEYEYNRQVAMVERGETIQKQTLHFDRDRKITYPMRSKEEAHDYRYFPDPDLPGFYVSQDWIAQIRDEIKELPWDVEKQLIDTYPLARSEARTIAYNQHLKESFLSLSNGIEAQAYKTLVDVFFQKLLSSDQTLQAYNGQQIQQFVTLIAQRRVNKYHAYEKLFAQISHHPDRDVEQIAAEMGLLQIDDSDFVGSLVSEVMNEHPDEVQRYRQGQKKLLGFFMGQVMKKSQGKAQAQQVKEVLSTYLDAT